MHDLFNQYPYNELLQEVKELIMETILPNISAEDCRALGMKPQDLANVTYTQIMALGYNDEDINATLGVLMEHLNNADGSKMSF